MSPVRSIVIAVAAGVCTACSAGAQYVPPGPDQLGSGQSSLVVAEAALPQTNSVRCENLGTFVVIRTGGQAGGTTTVLSIADTLRVESVELRDMGGFTGSYWRDVAGSAAATISGTTYNIHGTAEGFAIDNPSFAAARSFTITAAC